MAGYAENFAAGLERRQNLPRVSLDTGTPRERTGMTGRFRPSRGSEIFPVPSGARLPERMREIGGLKASVLARTTGLRRLSDLFTS